MMKRNNYNAELNIGIEIVSAVFVGVIAGLFLDNLFATKPIFIILCIVLSLVAALKVIWKKLIIKNGSQSS